MRRVSQNTVISLSEEQKKNILEEIHGFYLDERGEDIGMIQQ